MGIVPFTELGMGVWLQHPVCDGSLMDWLFGRQSITRLVFFIFSMIYDPALEQLFYYIDYLLESYLYFICSLKNSSRPLVFYSSVRAWILFESDFLLKGKLNFICSGSVFESSLKRRYQVA